MTTAPISDLAIHHHPTTDTVWLTVTPHPFHGPFTATHPAPPEPAPTVITLTADQARDLAVDLTVILGF